MEIASREPNRVSHLLCVHWQDVQCSVEQESGAIVIATTVILLLKWKISLLKTELAAAKSAVNNPITQNSFLQQSQTYSSVVQNNPDISSPNLIPPRASPTSGLQEKKFNVIVYGVEESPKGSNRHLRDIQDTRAVTEIFKSVEPQVPDHSLRDCQAREIFRNQTSTNSSETNSIL